jgi:RHS repeat-associated protein
VSALLAFVTPRRIKASHRRRRRIASGHFVQRYYDQTLGRFLSVDPVTADANTGAMFNRYKYAANNPYRFVDPDGRQEKDTRSLDRCLSCRGGNGSTVSLGGLPVPVAGEGPPVPVHGAPSVAQPERPLGQQAQRFLGEMWDTLVDKVLPAIPVEGQIAAGGKILAGAGFAAWTSRAVHLPGWNKLTINMTHIAERHMVGGPFTAGRSVFIGLNERGVEAAIRQAYGTAQIVKAQGDRVLLLGSTKTGMNVEIWLNRVSNTVETAYPVVGR